MLNPKSLQELMASSGPNYGPVEQIWEIVATNNGINPADPNAAFTKFIWFQSFVNAYNLLMESMRDPMVAVNFTALVRADINSYFERNMKDPFVPPANTH